jgi:hypothetical protein
MSVNKSVNDAILEPFLMAQDLAESQAQLMILLSEHAEPRIKGIIIGRLRGYLNGHQYDPDYEDVLSEAKTRLVIYLRDLKADLTVGPCKDFRNYVAAITHTACHDYFRQRYPARARLDKRIRDLLKVSRQLDVWRYHDEAVNEWVCGFATWRGARSSANAAVWFQYFDENSDAVSETLATLGDVQLLKLEDLVAWIFQLVGEPLRVGDVVDLVAHFRGIKDIPVLSFEGNDRIANSRLSDPKLRIDSILELREPLKRVWRGLTQLPSDECKAYLFYARDASGEDLITLFLAARIVTEREIAALLEISLAEFRELWPNRLPLDNETISKQLGITVARVYKLRCRAGKRVRQFVAEIDHEK